MRRHFFNVRQAALPSLRLSSFSKTTWEMVLCYTSRYTSIFNIFPKSFSEQAIATEKGLIDWLAHLFQLGFLPMLEEKRYPPISTYMILQIPVIDR